MYEERKNNFSIRDVILQLLIVVLFVFIMIWLFPTKNYLDENFVGKEELSSEISMQLQPIYGRLFTDNVESMRDAAQGYFTNERLPKKIGDTVSISLEEMLEKKLVIPFKDSNNQSCDVNKSYVQVTKMNDEYQMKVQLSCSDFEDYIIVYMGCYDYCDEEICEAKPTPSPEKPTKPSNPDPEPEKPIVSKKYEYEYRLEVSNTYSNWGPWSSWSLNKVTPNTLRQVEIDKKNEITGYRTETYIDYETHTEYRYETTKVQVGTDKELVGTSTDRKPAVSTGGGTKKVEVSPIVNKTEGGYGNWVYQGYTTSKYSLSSGNTVRYDYVSHKTTVDCTDVCKNVTIYTYKKYTRTYTSGKTTYSCPSGASAVGSGSSLKCYKYVSDGSTTLSCSKYGSDYKLIGSECVKTINEYKEVPIYETSTIKVPYTVTEEVEKTKKVPIWENRTYYRYRTREQLTEAGYIYKWSKSKNDKTLLEAGYELTGRKREV